MRRRMVLRKKYVWKNHMKKSNIVVLVIIALLISIYMVFHWMNEKIMPGLMEYAEIETRKFTTILINQSLSDQFIQELDVDELFLITKDTNGEIRTIDFNPITVNRLLVEATNQIQVNFKYINRGELEKLTISEEVLRNYDVDSLRKGVIANIPSGSFLKNAFLSNLGPKIPVKLVIVGDIVSNIGTKITNYGINNALLEVSIHLEITTQTILPFSSKNIKITSDIPIALKLIQGSVPSYYFHTMDKNSSILNVPVE